LAGHSAFVHCVAISADGTRVVTGSNDTLVKIWNAETGAEVCTLKGHTDKVRFVAFSRDGTRIVSGSYDHLLKIWDAGSRAEDEDGEPIIHPGCPLTGHSEAVHQVEFSDDGTQVISGSGDHTVLVW
ncbi:WD40-repeat-containing domain protein, partial [Baffinella frigidus]